MLQAFAVYFAYGGVSRAKGGIIVSGHIHILFIVIILVYILQAILSYFQIMDYRRCVKEAGRLGKAAVTSKKGIFSGEVIIAVYDNDGQMLKAFKMKGRTVFARFKELSMEDLQALQENTSVAGKEQPAKGM